VFTVRNGFFITRRKLKERKGSLYLPLPVRRCRTAGYKNGDQVRICVNSSRAFFILPENGMEVDDLLQEIEEALRPNTSSP